MDDIKSIKLPFEDIILADGWPPKDVPRISKLMQADKWRLVFEDWKKLKNG